MNTLKDILGNDEFLRNYPHFGSMNIKLFLSVCAYRKQEAVNYFGKETLLRVLKLANRQCPQFYHEFYLNKTKDPGFYDDFFSREMSLIAVKDLERKGENIIEETTASLKERGLFAGAWRRYQPDSYPEGPPADSLDESTPRIVAYQEEYMVEELRILVNSGSFPLCTIPVFSSWGNEYTQHTGEVPDPLGEGDQIIGYLLIKMTGFDNESQKFIFTHIRFEEKEDYSFEGWAEKSITGQPGYGTLSCYYIENYIHPLFYTYDIDNSESIKEKRHGAFNIVKKSISTVDVRKTMLAFVVIAVVLVILLYLVYPKKSDQVSDVDKVQEITEQELADEKKEEKTGEETKTPTEDSKQEESKVEEIKVEETLKEESIVKKEEPPEEKEKVEEDKKEKPISTKTPASESKSRRQKPGFYYTTEDYLYIQVYPGNNVSQLERALFLKKRELYKYNSAKRLRRLKAYTWLKVPLSRIRPFMIYKFKRGDTITSLSKQFHTTRYSIMVLNHTWSDKSIKPGYLALILKERKSRGAGGR